MKVLQAVHELDVPDAIVMSGAVYQTVWNSLTGRDPDYGIKDYDVGYFDPDTSESAESAVIDRVAAAFDEPLRSKVEARNQARVHIWFPTKFGLPYEPLQSAGEALDRFVCPAFAVGVSLDDNDQLDVTAPYGLDDVFDMRLRPTPGRDRALDWDRIIGSVTTRWPEATVTTS